jgi:hypothetical protein
MARLAQDAAMSEHIEKRRWPRSRVDLAVVVSHPEGPPQTRVVDLSEGGACLQWRLPEGIRVGERLRLRFLMEAGQDLELDARVARVDAEHAGLMFDVSQRHLVQQLLAEARSTD